MWIPVLVVLRYGIDNLYQQKYSLDDLILQIHSNSTDNIFIIMDGLDEYREDVNKLFEKINQLKRKFPRLKKTITTSICNSK